MEQYSTDLKEEKLLVKMSQKEKDRLMNFTRKNHLNMSSLVRALISDYIDAKEDKNDFRTGS